MKKNRTYMFFVFPLFISFLLLRVLTGDRSFLFELRKSLIRYSGWTMQQQRSEQQIRIVKEKIGNNSRSVFAIRYVGIDFYCYGWKGKVVVAMMVVVVLGTICCLLNNGTCMNFSRMTDQ